MVTVQAETMALQSLCSLRSLRLIRIHLLCAEQISALRKAGPGVVKRAATKTAALHREVLGVILRA